MLERHRAAVQRLKEFIFGQHRTNEEEPNDGPDVAWPPNPCVEPEWVDGAEAAGTIEVAIFHGGDREAAEVLRDHAEYAISDCYGDEYAVDVWVGGEVQTDVNDFQEWGRYVTEELTDDERASHANHLLTGTVDLYGGGNSSISPSKYIAQLHGECPRAKGDKRAHEYIASALHEIGHALGHNHRKDDRVHEWGLTWVPPMAATYADGTRWVFEYQSRADDRKFSMN